jgi:hypothetical protein
MGRPEVLKLMEAAQPLAVDQAPIMERPLHHLSQFPCCPSPLFAWPKDELLEIIPQTHPITRAQPIQVELGKLHGEFEPLVGE